MSTSDPAENSSFLSLCLYYAGGKIDFDAVISDFEATHKQKLSKGAAQKRYQRWKAKMKESVDGGGSATATKQGLNRPRKKIKVETSEDKVAWEGSEPGRGRQEFELIKF
jgi:hypothetical protein